MAFRDFTGRRVGRLVVLCRADKGPGPYFLCRCDCGSERVVKGSSLKDGKTVSCGCYHRDERRAAMTTHGASKRAQWTPEFQAWVSMIKRCTNPRNKFYSSYGGRGVTICERWRHSFETFLADLGPRPSSDHSLDRIDNDGHYDPANCRWATRAKQQRNRRCSPKHDQAIWLMCAGLL